MFYKKHKKNRVKAPGQNAFFTGGANLFVSLQQNSFHVCSLLPI
jgi:hypothetical protein